jgi:hypothetical protein
VVRSDQKSVTVAWDDWSALISEISASILALVGITQSPGLTSGLNKFIGGHQFLVFLENWGSGIFYRARDCTWCNSRRHGNTSQISSAFFLFLQKNPPDQAPFFWRDEIMKMSVEVSQVNKN